MPTLRFGKVWQVIRHFGVLFLQLGIPKKLFQISSPRGKLRPHVFPHMVTPTMFPVDKKWWRTQKSQLHFCINSLVPKSYLTIASSGLFLGAYGGPYEIKPYLFACWRVYDILRIFVPGLKHPLANKLFDIFRVNHGVERLWPIPWHVT